MCTWWYGFDRVENHKTPVNVRKTKCYRNCITFIGHSKSQCWNTHNINLIVTFRRTNTTEFNSVRLNSRNETIESNNFTRSGVKAIKVNPKWPIEQNRKINIKNNSIFCCKPNPHIRIPSDRAPKPIIIFPILIDLNRFQFFILVSTSSSACCGSFAAFLTYLTLVRALYVHATHHREKDPTHTHTLASASPTAERAETEYFCY